MESRPDVTESVTSPEAGGARVLLHNWSLEVSAGPDKGRRFETLGTLIRVGSDNSNDVVLTDTTVSRRHLEVERTPEGLVVRDLGSRNGTLVEGRRVLAAYVGPGDKISLGKTKLTVREEDRTTEVEASGTDSFGQLVGSSEKMRVLFADLRRVAREDVSVLLCGETGTGKELAARAIHQHSLRRHGAFRVVDCNLISEDAADRELFGKGAEGNEGVFQAAAGGTVFLDEVGELPASIQPKLLRVLENRELPSLSGPPVKLDVRIIASTQQNLEEEVRVGRFRADLFYRLAVANLRLPPLRTRRDDIPVLARHLLKSVGGRLELTSQMLSLLEGYGWPGNVRELRNVLERGALMQETGNTSWLDLLAGPALKEGPPTRSVAEVVVGLPYHEAKDRVTADFERLYFAEMMKTVGFDLRLAEERTGLSMQSLYRLLKKNGLRLKDLKNAEGLEK